MATATENAIQQIYIGLLGRSADPEGLAYWAAEIDGGTLTLEQLRANIVNEQPEYAAGLGLLTRTQTVEALYQNMFERAADAEGLEYWVNGGGASVNTDQLVLALIDGAAAADTLVLDNKTEAAIYYTENTAQADFTTDAATASVDDVDSTSDSVDASKTATDGGSQSAGQTFTLTTGVDTVIGTTDNDTIKGLIDGGDSTLTALDTIDGGAGTDTLAIDATGALTLPAGVSLSNVETMTLRSVGATTADTSTGYAGLTTLNSTLAVAANLTAAATTDINVSGATGAITVEGGKDVTVTDATANKAITVGDAAATTGSPAGTITVTDTDNSGAAVTTVTGGTDVTVTTTADATSGNIVVGHATNGAASGAVVVTQNTTSDASAAVTAGDVTVIGGSTITVAANIANTATTGNNTNVVAGTYSATAGNTTTAVSITQTNTATDLEAVVTAGTNETSVLTFGALAAGEAVLVGETGGATGGTDLTFVASKALTAAEVAAAVASLTAADTQAAGGVVANGYFTGALDAGWTSAAVSGATVTFTATTVGAKTNLDVYTDADGAGAADNGAAADADYAAVVVDGTDDVTVAAQDVTATDGDVVVNDNATASITTVTLSGFNDADLNGLDALTTLSLTDGGNDVVLDTTQTTLALTLDGMAVASTANLDDAGASITSLDVTASGSDSDIDLTATVLVSATIAASADLDLSGSTFGALETVTVTGSGDVALGDISADATALTASASTGAISATVDGTKAVVTTGSGNDTVTVDTAGISKNIDLGSGDDTLVLNTDTTTVPTGAVTGGAGTDTLSMTIASAAAFDANTNLATAVTDFERLTISDRVDVDGGVTIDLEALGFNYVTTNGTDDSVDTGADTTDDGDTLTLANIASNGTVVLNNTQTQTGHANLTSAIVVSVKDAATGTADVLNVATNVVQADIDAGTLTAADVEAINITADDSDNDHDSDGELFEAGERQLSTLDLNATSATTVTIDGDASLTLDMTGNTAVTAINASALTGNLTVTAFGTATVTGGTGNDALTADGSGDTLLGGAGNDTLTGADLTTLTGGDGVDTFVVNIPTNVNSYSTITDLSSGDVIQLTATESFVSSAITLAGTAVFQDYANAAVNGLATDDEDAAWFQFGDNTYVVINDDQADLVNADFENGADAIIQITGLVDLSAASYNMTDGTLEIA